MKKSATYIAALKEAANYMQEGKDVPVSIIEKAIGKCPSFYDSPDYDTLIATSNILNRYRIEKVAFLNAAYHLARPWIKG